MKIHREYRGASGGYHIMLNGEQVYFSKDDYQASMFMAELKAKTATSEETQRILSLNERMKQKLDRFENAFEKLSTGNFSAPMELSQVEAYQAYAASMLEFIRKEE